MQINSLYQLPRHEAKRIRRRGGPRTNCFHARSFVIMEKAGSRGRKVALPVLQFLQSLKRQWELDYSVVGMARERCFQEI